MGRATLPLVGTWLLIPRSLSGSTVGSPQPACAQAPAHTSRAPRMLAWQGGTAQMGLLPSGG